MDLLEMGLVLEGGGLRGAFTTGVLDAFMENELYFPYTIGVSAGANNGMSYVARQRGRSFYCNIRILRSQNYIGIGHYLKGNGYVNLKYLIKDYPEKNMPLDFKTYSGVNNRLVMVTSNCLTGNAEYLEEKNDKTRLLDICEASCSLPFLCPEKYVDGIPMLDGGICDSIPVVRAMNDGFANNVVVLTKCRGYRKSNRKLYLPWFVFKNYPQIRKILKMRNMYYNEILDYVEELENKGSVYVIRPLGPMSVSRTTTDYSALEALYFQGKTVGEHFIRQMS